VAEEPTQALTTAQAHDGRVFHVGDVFRLDISHRSGGDLFDDLNGQQCALVGIIDANIGVFRFKGEVECRTYEFCYIVSEDSWVVRDTIHPR
jgi:hypothetical protein